MGSLDERPIAGTNELVQYFVDGAKPPDACRVGMEHEKIGVTADGGPLDHATIVQLLERLAARGWRRIEEGGLLIALDHETYGSVTLEPGGQLEHSGKPWPSAVAAALDNDQHIDDVLTAAEEMGVYFLGIGFRPFRTLDQVPWMPKGRYRVMREYLPSRGRLAHEMMKRTATVQSNLDYLDEDDAMDKLRVALGVSSLVTALFAASPLVDGVPSGYQSYRAACWLETDPDRCGLLPFAFNPNVRFRDYVEWALDVPLLFLYRAGVYHQAGGVTFRQYMRDGIDGHHPTLVDWERHLSTLFPEVRLKRYVEVRQADSGPREMVRALPALWRGLLYDVDSRHATWSLVRDWTMQERIDLYRDTPKRGLHATVRGIAVGTLCEQLVATARQGLLRLGAPDGALLLAPLERICRERRTIADDIVEMHRRAKGEPKQLIEALRLRR